MKFALGIQKKNRANLGTVHGHNTRLNETASQLPKEAWFTPQGLHEVMPWRADLVDQAKGLARRKDAVLAVELIVQVGNQADWREMPTPEHPCGKRKPGAGPKLNALMAGAKAAALKEFGKERIVSISLHTDESTPHVHVVFVPIKDGKLQAKAWLNGAASCAKLRQQLHASVSSHIACTYTPGAPGGEPHDVSRAAGAINGPKPKPGLLERAVDALGAVSEIKGLKKALAAAEAQIQAGFSRLKRAEQISKEERGLRVAAEERAAAAELREAKSRRNVEILQGEVEMLKIRLKPAPAPQLRPEPASKPKPSVLPVKSWEEPDRPRKTPRPGM
jgi:hypothetical protein